MRLTFGPYDEHAAAAAREALTERFAEWLQRRDARGADAEDARLLLDWKWDYGDGDYATWRRADVDELLLEHLPRKLSAPPAEAASIPASLAAFAAFLAEEGLLSNRSDAAEEVGRRALAQQRAFEDAMADPSRFGMAKRLFDFAGFDSDDIVDQDALDKAVARFNSLPFEERDRILGLSDRPAPEPDLPLLPVLAIPSEAVLVALASEVPMLDAVERLHAAVGEAGIRLTKAGNPTVADGRRLADAVGVDADVRDIRSSAELPELFAIARVAQLVGALEIHGPRLRASPSWTERGVVARWRDVVSGTLDAGASTLHFGAYTPMPWQLAELADGLALHVLALLWLDGSELPVGAFVEVLQAAQLDLDRSGSATASMLELGPIAERRIDEVIESLVAVGVVELSEGAARLTAAAPALVADALSDVGFDVLLPASLRELSAESFVDQFMERDDDPAIVMSIWAGDRDSAALAAELIATLLDRPEPARVLCGFVLLQELGDAALGPVEAALDSAVAPLAWLHLMSAGRIDPEDVPREIMVEAGVNLFAAMADVGSPADVIDPLLGGISPADQGRFVGELASSHHPRTGELLELIGRHHPDRAVGKHARKAAHRWRSAHG